MKKIFGALAVAAVLASACDDSTGPGPKETVTLDFCSGETPIWLAIQNEGEAWEEVSVGSDGSATFDARPSISVAYVTQPDASDYRTVILNVSRDELESIHGQPCTERRGTRTLSGSVTGLTGQQVARIGLGWSTSGASTSNTTYTLSGLPEGSRDLIATRAATSTTQPPDRVIVQRGVNLGSGSTIPALDFGSAQAVALATNTATFVNRGNDLVSLVSEVITENGTSHRLMEFSGASADAASFVSLPQSVRLSSDRHVLSAYTSGGAGTREVVGYFTTPGNRTVTFGPNLNTGTFSVLAAAPMVRPRATIASQSEYGDAMQATFSQSASHGFRMITMLTSLRFRGSLPATWELEMPDLSAAGYDSDWGLVAPTSGPTAIAANLRGFDSNVALAFGAEPTASDVTVRSATRFAASVTGP